MFLEGVPKNFPKNYTKILKWCIIHTYWRKDMIVNIVKFIALIIITFFMCRIITNKKIDKRNSILKNTFFFFIVGVTYTFCETKI